MNFPPPTNSRWVATSMAIPVGSSAGATGQFAMTLCVAASMTSTACLSSMLTNTRPSPGSAWPLSAVPASGTVAATVPLSAALPGTARPGIEHDPLGAVRHVKAVRGAVDGQVIERTGTPDVDLTDLRVLIGGARRSTESDGNERNDQKGGGSRLHWHSSLTSLQVTDR